MADTKITIATLAFGEMFYTPYLQSMLWPQRAHLSAQRARIISSCAHCAVDSRAASWASWRSKAAALGSC